MLMLQPRSGCFGNEDAGGGRGGGGGVRKAALFRLLFIVFIILSIYFFQMPSTKTSLSARPRLKFDSADLFILAAILSSCIKLIISYHVFSFFHLKSFCKTFSKETTERLERGARQQADLNIYQVQIRTTVISNITAANC